jgi:hypothetical protein
VSLPKFPLVPLLPLAGAPVADVPGVTVCPPPVARAGFVGPALLEGLDTGADGVDDGRPAPRLYDPLLRGDAVCGDPPCEAPVCEDPVCEELECDDPLCDDPLRELDEGLLDDELLLLLLSLPHAGAVMETTRKSAAIEACQSCDLICADFMRLLHVKLAKRSP